MSNGKVVAFNPLDRLNLGASVTSALLQSEAVPLAGLPRFVGAGIYAIYYRGSFDAYRSLASKNREAWNQPIYVGKAIPAGARQGGIGLGDNPGAVLHTRLREHAESIRQAENLSEVDFACRYLVVEDIWIPLAESLLIARFAPLWNKVLDGFGNHDPGKGRHQGLRPRWDCLHPGRPWAARLQERPEPASLIESEVRQYLG